MKIVPVDKIKYGSGEFLKKYCPPDTDYIVSTRLDDDDALSPNFTKLVAKFVKEKKLDDYIISFPFGFYLNIDRNNKKIGYMPLKIVRSSHFYFFNFIFFNRARISFIIYS